MMGTINEDDFLVSAHRFLCVLHLFICPSCPQICHLFIYLFFIFQFKYFKPIFSDKFNNSSKHQVWTTSSYFTWIKR